MFGKRKPTRYDAFGDPIVDPAPLTHADFEALVETLPATHLLPALRSMLREYMEGDAEMGPKAVAAAVRDCCCGSTFEVQAWTKMPSEGGQINAVLVVEREEDGTWVAVRRSVGVWPRPDVPVFRDDEADAVEITARIMAWVGKSRPRVYWP